MKFFFLSGHAHLALDPASQRASGGAELQVALLSKELVARGHEIVIVAANTGQPDGIAWEGIRVRTGGAFDTGLPLDALRALPSLIRVLRAERPHYVVVYGWTAWLYILCLLRAVTRFRLDLRLCAGRRDRRRISPGQSVSRPSFRARHAPGGRSIRDHRKSGGTLP